MSSFPVTLFNKLFPARQLILRQNGEVRLINLAPWLQLFLVISIIAFSSWLVLSVQQVKQQEVTISSLQTSHLKTRQQLESELASQRSLFEQQQALLGELEQKQAILQGMVESLPEPVLNTSEQGSAEEGQQELPQEGVPFHEPIDESKPDSPFALGDRIQQLGMSADGLQERIAQAVSARNSELLTALEKAGISDALAQRLSEHGSTAQGGPLDAFNESLLSKAYLNTADALLALNNLENLVSFVPSTLPAEDYYVSSSYGLRKDPLTGRRAFHKGVDLAGWRNTKIFAPAEGTVKRAGRNGGYGNFIEIEHANGFTTRFGHLNKIKVKKGELVAKNQVIGLMGSTGRSTSTHLHYEVLYNDKQINPIKITKALTRVY